ncbi:MULTISPECIES: endonuclease domain-containing protein [unclassified Arenibacter]|jgi:very-short-patch-repair endonuclease|uniref:endonuclease domain-containing protein n=1 Tax=unclassified Arenibacter TaxID=2615047 RepID=UPI002043E07A|nr:MULTISPECIES: endonuclease domain-containing protein [unclassified Arenibacter]
MKKDNPYYDESMWKGAKPDTFAKAQHLREQMTETEIILWNRLKDNKEEGYKFRRQHPIHKFIVDFYCHQAKLIIEIDGKYHESDHQKQYDLDRSKILTFQGLKILRFTNEEIMNDIENVIKKIKQNIKNDSLPRP